MTPVVLKARFDGREIKLDEPCQLPPNTPLMVTVLPSPLPDGLWLELAKASLAQACGDAEPGYPLGLVAAAGR
jgi:hypothetical protein